MNRLILIKYGELTTKKGNRNFFIKTLTKNIEHKLSNFDVKIKKDLSPLLVSILKVLNSFSFNNSNTVLAISSILVFVI